MGQRKTEVLTSELLAAIASKDPVAGLTHNFYRYPARFSPLFVREVIRQYTAPGEVVLDPFMGGGTTIVEAISMGRKALGNDINPLAHFVTSVKTTPLSKNDIVLLQAWASALKRAPGAIRGRSTSPIKNFSPEIQAICAGLIARAESLPLGRNRRFIRCVILKTSQWAVDCKRIVPDRSAFLERFFSDLSEMLSGMNQFIAACSEQGVKRSEIRRSRHLLCRDTCSLEADRKIQSLPRAKLVVTSPPYPSVHILYHRWQAFGRRETPAPYWIADLNDGQTAQFYTFGGRSYLGRRQYFASIEQAFRSVRDTTSSAVTVVQMLAFADAGSDLPCYLEAMDKAGFKEHDCAFVDGNQRIWRDVPNRRWYCHNGRERDSSREVFLVHRSK